jgi:hypothetical protein
MTNEERARMKMVEDIFRNGLAELLASYDSIKLALNFMEKKEKIEGLGQFKHYCDHLLECHRILDSEWQRRWGSLKLQEEEEPADDAREA